MGDEVGLLVFRNLAGWYKIKKSVGAGRKGFEFGIPNAEGGNANAELGMLKAELSKQSAERSKRKNAGSFEGRKLGSWDVAKLGMTTHCGTNETNRTNTTNQTCEQPTTDN